MANDRWPWRQLKVNAALPADAPRRLGEDVFVTQCLPRTGWLEPTAQKFQSQGPDHGRAPRHKIGTNQRRNTEVRLTHRWRGQSAANSSRKWSSQSQVFWDADGKMDPFPQAVGLSKRLVLFIFCECAFGPRRLIFPPIKESAARLGPNLFKTSGFLANYGSKAYDIGGLDRNDHSGVL